MNTYRIPFILAVIAALTLPLAASAHHLAKNLTVKPTTVIQAHKGLVTTTLRLGVYDCMAFSVVTGFLDYKESVALLPGGRYQQAFGRHRTRMIKPTTGTYRIAGSLLIFRGGALAMNPGRIYLHGHAFPFFSLLLHGKPSGWSCYYVAKP